MTFRIEAFPYDPFAPLFALSDDALAARRARRVTADACPGFPCRVSLEDAEPGEILILIHHRHHDADTPYDASHAVFVREHAVRAEPEAGVLPSMLLRRPLSLRAFDADGMMIAADLAEGNGVSDVIDAMLSADAAQVHLHNAKPGCYAARALPA